jgi:predicted Rossmann-fold nucleotide-binding protein
VQREELGEAVPDLPKTPYDPWRDKLYSVDELMEGWSPGQTHAPTLDARIFEHAKSTKTAGEALAQRVHDYSIDQALGEFIGDRRDRLVGIMGGSSSSLGDPKTAQDYKQAARLGKLLAEAGYLVVSGGGLGIMEAANLGASLAGRSSAELDQAFEELGEVAYKGHEARYLEIATAIRHRSEPVHESIGVPTWVYKDEPVSQFATHVAKYFANSIREDGLLGMCLAGVVYCPGKSGTTQEVFQDAAQNAYRSFEFRSPMVMLGSTFFAETGLYAVLCDQSVRNTKSDDPYRDLITLVDDPAAAVAFIDAHRPAVPPAAQAASGAQLVQTLRTALRYR